MPKWGNVVFDDLLNLKSKMQWLTKTQNEKFIRETARELAQILYAMLMKRTPVDTGTLRKGWSIDYSVVRKGQNYEITLYNNTPYASFVEFGHRTKSHKGWVDGQYFMTLSELELEKLMPSYIEAKLITHLQEVFK